MEELICHLINCLLPEWVMVTLGLLALAAALMHMVINGSRNAIIMAVGALNYVLVYVWIGLTEPTLVQRAIYVRLATVYILLSIILYSLKRAGALTQLRRLPQRIVRQKNRGTLG